MARVASALTLWSVICLQLAFFLLLSALFFWKDHSLPLRRHHDTKQPSYRPAEVTLKSHVIKKDFLSNKPPQSWLLRASQRKLHRGAKLHTRDYKYRLNPAGTVCSEPVYLLVLVESTTYNAMERDYFRKRWKTSEYNDRKIATVFVTAHSAVESAEELLQLEQDENGDILHIDFEDSYRNLTLKTMLGLRWAMEECQPFDYLMKTDDDMIVNFDVLITLLEKLPSNMTTDLYTGVMMSNKPPIRNRSDKWHVTLAEYPHDRYPDYMGGPGYVLAYQAVSKVLAASYHIPFMPMEDVFVGICAQKAGIKGYSSIRFSNWEIWDYYNYCWAKEMTILHKADYIVRELYYYDKYINTHSFDFKSWGRTDLYRTLGFAQQRANRANQPAEFMGYPMIYRCSSTTWQTIKAKCLHKHIANWKIPLQQIIDI